MVTLKEWLQAEKKDYGIGLALLGKYSKNRVLLQNLSRKANPAKVEFELKRAFEREELSGKKATVLVVDEMKGKKESHSDKVIDQMNKDKKPNAENDLEQIASEKLNDLEDSADDVIAEKLEEFETAAREIVSGKLEIVRNGKKIKYEDLPETIQNRWNTNRDNYKEIRSLHEKLKLMEKATPEQRQPLTQRICTLDDAIRENWNIIDAWQPGDETERTANIDHKRINANRKYISTNTKKLAAEKDETKAATLRKKIQERVTELKNAEEEMNEKTVSELKGLGIEW